MLEESKASILAIYSFNLFKTTGIAEALLEIFCLSSCSFSVSSESAITGRPAVSLIRPVQARKP